MPEITITKLIRGWLAGFNRVLTPRRSGLLVGMVVVQGMLLSPVVDAQGGVGQGRSALGFRDLGALPFIGPPAAVNLDQELDALSMASGLDPAQAKALGSVSGKQAIWQAINDHVREHRSAIFQQALSKYAADTDFSLAQPGDDAGLADVFRPLIPYADGLKHDLKALSNELQRIARSLKDDSELAVRLRNVLQSPGAAEAIYVSLVYPVYLATGEAPTIENMLVRNGEGRTVVATKSRDSAKSIVDRLEPMISTVDQLTDEAIRNAAQIVEKDSLHRGFKDALSDPMMTAVSASLQMRRNPAVTAGQLRDSVSGNLNKRLTSTADGKVLANDLPTSGLKKNLILLHRLRAIARSNANGLQALLADMDPEDNLDRTFKNVMSSPVAAASLIPEQAFKPIPELFLKSTIFGSSLLEESDGSWSINSHRKREMAIVVAYLEQRLRDFQEHGDKLGDMALTLQPDGSGHNLIALTLLQMVEMETWRDIQGLASHWIDAHFEREGEGYRLRTEKARQIGGIVNSVAQQLSPIAINSGPEGYSDNNSHLLKSSAYIYLGTKFSHEVYFDEFEDHYAARVWGIFEWNAQEATDLEAFRNSLARQAPYLRQIAATHEKVIIYVFQTPKWLSASSDQSDFDGRPAYLMHSPKDYGAWRRLVGETARFLQQHLADVDVYYEFWNEPEIYWPEGTDEFLRLYGETVGAIRKNHPEAKIGGATVNGWEGKTKGARGGDPLNLELIRYAVANDIPLDFISWHHFERPLADLEVAKKAYTGELKKLGVDNMPEFVISEWSIPGRGTGFEAIAFAEYMLALYRSGVDIQTVSAWDEFNVLARPNHLPPWGMLTHQGLKKPMFYVHSFFDRLSRNSEGIAVFETQDRKTRIIVSRKRDGSLELVVWESRYNQRLEAALEYLRERKLGPQEFRQYGSVEQLEKSIRDGKAIQQEHVEFFRRASEIYHDDREPYNLLSLRFAGARQLRVTASEAVGIRSLGRQVFSDGPDLLMNLPRGEVMWLRVEID